MLSPRTGRAARGGFSLIEMMVTLTILGFLLVATMPSIGAWLRNTEIRNAAESISNGLAKARAEAVRRNLPVRFTLVSTATDNPGLLDVNCAASATSASWVVSLDNPAGACGNAVSETNAPRILAKFAQGDGSRNVTVSVRGADCTSASGNTQVVYGGFGRVDTAANPIRCLVIGHSSGATVRPLNVVISPGGTVRSCDPAVTDNNDPRKC
ncbi:GspH/FimT family pseudopilin [Leptothrix discophora]|uniref:Type II secretion system protein H n=1 Tax=Leptothrix discophora TaxID=89 RepID=A0ABT9G0X1_LEPDI|nr:GspH/FimT family pseudopilin [Leptothrix discophora]MDP4300098.1 GspH/FimT family pseudopilin [Leptothrix discophora]